MYKIKGLIIGILTFVSMAMYAQSVVVTGKPKFRSILV